MQSKKTAAKSWWATKQTRQCRPPVFPAVSIPESWDRMNNSHLITIPNLFWSTVGHLASLRNSQAPKHSGSRYPTAAQAVTQEIHKNSALLYPKMLCLSPGWSVMGQREQWALSLCPACACACTLHYVTYVYMDNMNYIHMIIYTIYNIYILIDTELISWHIPLPTLPF